MALWHAAGRAAVDSRKRLLALQGVALSGPALLLGSFLAGLLSLPARTTQLTRPVAYVLEPLQHAYAHDRDGALLLWVTFEALLLTLVWGWTGGALSRLAAVDLTGRGRERGPEALVFARRRLGALWGVPIFFGLAMLLPLVAAWLFSLLATLPGALGGVLAPLAIVGVVVLALVAVVGATLVAACAFLARPAVAVDDADLWDAVSRCVTYAWGGLPRLVAVRLWFFTGVLVGSGWRLVRTVLTALIAVWLLEHALGEARLGRLLSILGARGLPQDALRQGIGAFDLVAAGTLGLCGALLVALWLADLISRVACARVAAYLVLRRAVDRVSLSSLRTLPGETHSLTAEEAGFHEVTRVGTP